MVKNVVALLTGTIALILGLMFSVVFLSVVAVLGLAIWAYVWWKTRALRQSMKQQAPDGHVIDGEAVVVEEYHARIEDDLPGDPPKQ